MKRYSQNHEWVDAQDSVATVGISDYAAEELGDITFVELPEAGRQVAKGDVLCVVESVKAASDVYAPIGGTVSEVNSELEGTPEIINDSPEEKGWLCKLENVNKEDVDGLMDPDAYKTFVAES